MEEINPVERGLKWRIKKGRNTYSERMENALQQSSGREVWSGMRKIADYGQAGQMAEWTKDRRYGAPKLSFDHSLLFNPRVTQKMIRSAIFKNASKPLFLV